MKQVTKKDGSKAAYIDLTTYLDTDKNSEFGDHGFISQQVSQEEREAGTQTPILGNCKVVWSDLDGAAQESSAPTQPKQNDLMDDDIPF